MAWNRVLGLALGLAMMAATEGAVTSEAEAAPAASPDNTLVLELDIGKVEIAMRPDVAPRHVARIKELVNQKFYDGIIFHRVIANFMAQTGDPKGTGTGGSGVKIQAEFSDVLFERGIVGMARANHPDSADSQFFITYARAEFLDRKYTVWGEVTQGMGVVNRIAKGEPPAKPNKIIKAYLASNPR